MHRLRPILNIYLYGNIHIAICTTCLCVFSYLSSDLIPDSNYLLFVFFSTWAMYSMHRIAGNRKMHPDQVNSRFTIIARHIKTIKTFAMVGAFLSVFFFLRLDDSTKLLLFIPIVLSAIYVVPIMGKQLRDVAYIKLLLIAIIFTIICLVIPLYNDVENEIILRSSVVLLLFMLSLTIPFDIRDKEIDHKEGIKTLVTWLGTSLSKSIAIMLALAAIVLCLFNLSSPFYVAMLPTLSMAVLLVARCRSDIADYYYTGLMDGVMIVPLVTGYLVT